MNSPVRKNVQIKSDQDVSSRICISVFYFWGFVRIQEGTKKGSRNELLMIVDQTKVLSGSFSPSVSLFLAHLSPVAPLPRS